MSQLLSDRMEEIMLELSDTSNRSLAQQFLVESLGVSSSTSRDDQLRNYIGNMLQSDFLTAQRLQHGEGMNASNGDLINVDPSKNVQSEYRRLEEEAADSITDILMHRLLDECFNTLF